MMFCFQSPFTRSSRGVVPTVTVSPSQTKSTAPLSTIAATTTSTTTGNMKQSTKSKRRSSGTTSEGSSSSIRYIDHGHSMSSSTDTLPGIKADYLESERLSSEHTVLTLPSAVDTNDRQNLLLADDNHRGRRSSSSPRSSPTRKSPSSSETGSSWRRMLPLRLRSTDSSNSNVTSQSSNGEVFSSTTSSPVTSESASLGKGNGQLDFDYRSVAPMKISTPPPISVLVEVDDEQQSSRASGPGTMSLKEVPSSQTSCSETEEVEDEEGIQKPEGSSLPSSPAVTTVRQVSNTGRKTSSSVKYYDFLSVNGGPIRQDATSTSSPQLSSASSNRSSSESSSCKKSSESHEDRGKSGPDKQKPKANECSASLPAARSCPNLGISTSGAKFDPLDEGDIQICYFNNSKTIMKKVLYSKFLRRLEAHHLYLNDAHLSSQTRAGFLQRPIPYSSMLEVRKYGGTRWNGTYRNCLNIVLPGGSLLLQASDAYTRDHWYYSILWKKSIFKYQHSVSVSTTSNLVLNELEEMVKFVQDTPVQGERVAGALLEAAAKLLEEPETNGTVGKSEKTRYAWRKETEKDKRRWAEKVLAITAPLLEIAAPPPALARELARLADLHPTSQLVSTLTPAITRCLKHIVDFSKTPDMRKLIQGFIAALYENEKGEQAVRDYITSIHGPGSDCPHPRVLPNLVSVCLAAISHWYDVLDSNRKSGQDSDSLPPVDCYFLVLRIVSEYADWLPGLGALLQPVPLKKDALAMKQVQESVLLCVMRRIARDTRCSVHKVVLPVRESQPGWIYIAAPSHLACPDSGELFGEMLTTLLGCCCRGKGFIESLMQKACNDCMLLAVRGCAAAQEALCLTLEWLLLTNEETRLQVVNALESTDSGKNRYTELCHRQRDLQELQQKGGPRKLTLPVRATDADVALYLAGRPLGNLECLVLAFTSVTSACAEQLIKLPALTYLDLWATQFGDAGLQMISEHLLNLEVLNLCETPVSDRGISTLASLTSLRKLNLNSTKLSAQTFESLRKRLPALQEFDVRYTEAW